MERLEAILRKFTLGKWMKSVPEQLWELITFSASCHHHAKVDIKVSHIQQLVV